MYSPISLLHLSSFFVRNPKAISVSNRQSELTLCGPCSHLVRLFAAFVNPLRLFRALR